MQDLSRASSRLSLSKVNNLRNYRLFTLRLMLLSSKVRVISVALAAKRNAKLFYA